MEGFDTLQYALGDSIYSVAYKLTKEASEESLPPFATSNQNTLDSLQGAIPLEQLTTSSIILALIVMFFLGLTTYFVKKKGVNKLISYIPPVLIGILLIAFIARWKLFESVPYGIESYILYGLLVIGLAMLIWLGVIVSRKDNDVENVSLFWPFIIIGCYGTVVYDIGMYTQGGISLITNLPMAILYGFKIFILDSDVSEIHEPFHASWLYSANFALVHFLAAGLSMLFVVKHFGFNIIQRLRMWWIAKFPLSFKREDTFLFWGYNDATKDLAKSIIKHYGEDHKAYRIIIVRTDKDETDTPEDKTAFSRIFNFISMRNAEIDSLRELDCLTVGIYDCLKRDEDSDSSTCRDILKSKLNLKSLSHILLRKTTKKIHLLFLLDDEKENIRWMNILLKDSTIEKFVSKTHREVKFYCHARYNSVHRVTEDLNSSDRIKVKVIDSSHINVENLKLKEDLLPVKYVNVEKDATVSTPFNSLVIGFSEFGQDAVRFLYEYGAFVRSGSTNADVKRSEFHMRVVDKRMDEVAGPFVANAPAINVSAPFVTSVKGMNNPDALITLNKMDCQSIEFYKGLETWIKDLNYIVIATENDELNISLAVRIFKMAARYREGMEKLCILTRVHEDEDGVIKETADYYNLLWKAQCAVKEYNGKISTQSEIKRSHVAALPIYLFGLDKETYTYKNIIDESMEQQAVEFKERYTASTQKDYIKPQSREDYAWYKEIRDNILFIEKDSDNNPTLSAIMGIRRMQGQDYANCFHSATKKILAQEALKKSGLPKEFSWNLLTRKFKTIEYMVKDGAVVVPQVFRILNVLAQTEHLRWNASHEILGYVKGGTFPSRNEVKMQHSCITDWHELTPEIQSFDYDFVDLTLNIINPERPQKNK